MKFKQITTIVFTQEVELSKDEAQEIVDIPSMREKELSEAWEISIVDCVIGKLGSDQTLSVSTEIICEEE